MSDREPPRREPPRRDRVTFGSVVDATWRRIHNRPRLCLPFLLAGAVVALADWIRRLDPLPTAANGAFDYTLSVQYSVFPAGTARTVRAGGALLDLHAGYLAGALALELAAFLAVALAGLLTISRALDRDPDAAAFGRYLSVAAVFAFASRLVDVSVGSLAVSVPLAVIAAFVTVNLLVAPGFLAAGTSVRSAFRRSIAFSAGIRFSLFGLLLAFGVASWLLALVPYVGGFLSTAVVGTGQAVALAVLVGGAREERSD